MPNEQLQTHSPSEPHEALYSDPSLPITNIQIRNFRAFEQIDIGSFKRINLIAGLNNTGKTALLEAIFLVLARVDPRGPQRATGPEQLPTAFRIFSPQADLNENFWAWLFRDKQPSNEVRISFLNGKAEQQGIVISSRQFQQLPQQDRQGLEPINGLGRFHAWRERAAAPSPRAAIFGSHPSDPVQDAIDFNRVVLKRGKKRLEDLLRQVDPRLVAIEAIQTGQKPLIFADVGLPEMIPVAHLGEGFCRLLDIFSELLAGEVQVLLIDEIENGLHHSVLPIVWEGLFAAVKDLGVEIFATTHSAECIFAAHVAAKQNEPYDLRLIRLDRVKGEIKATVVDQSAMETAHEFKWELR